MINPYALADAIWEYLGVDGAADVYMIQDQFPKQRSEHIAMAIAVGCDRGQLEVTTEYVVKRGVNWRTDEG